MADPCKSRKEIENSDPERSSLLGLLSAWFAVFDNVSVKVKAVINNTDEQLKEALLEFVPNGCGGVNEISFGKKLQKYTKRIEGGYQLERMSTHQGAATWRVIKIK